MGAEAAKSSTPVDRTQMNVVIVGHVDHGKSTVVGRLLADTDALPQGKLDAVRRECERTGKPFEYAFLLDALEDEQDQGITIDTARCFFKSSKRDYIIIDAPGHIEFLKNMISGAARAEAAVLVIDAKEGVRENSRRHGYILAMLGIRQVVVCVNKMDLVGYDQAHFEGIEREYRGFLESIGAVSPRQFIPISAIEGENLASRGKKSAWYKGPTLLEVLDTLPKAPPKVDQPLRMPVQAVYKFTKQGDDRRIVAGRIEAGRVKVGDKVVFSPSNKVGTIRTIEGFNTAARSEIDAGWSTGFTLAEEIYITRGEILSHVAKAPHVGTRVRVNMIWLGKKPFVSGRDYKLKIGTAALPVRINKINKVIDASEAGSTLAKDHVGRHDVADLVLEARQPIAFDLTADCEATGRFVIVDEYDVAGGGIITGVVADDLGDLRAEARTRDFNWVQGGVTGADRAARYGHRSALVMFVGKAGVGKHQFARALEKALFDAGRNTYMLDGKNVLLGVDHDLWVDAAQSELVRRFGEVVHLLLNSGQIVVSTTNAIGLADATAVQALIPDAPLVLVEVGEGSAQACDLLVRGDEPAAEVIAKITALLDARGITKI
ncbi:MAG TPA: GTP-binding protein [Polyangia bacterium]|jgi:bifunctional enzyme CysN/CysC|nr:GTP-binding protein [Polyangia bacterium]